MKTIRWQTIVTVLALALSFSCDTHPPEQANQPPQTQKQLTAKDILGNPDYQAISFGGYREKSRDQQPTVGQLKEDLKILAAMNIKVLRTYNTKLAEAANLLKAIHELKQEDTNFEMYVMLGAWIDCQNAWTNQPPNHDAEDAEANAAEIQRAVDMANQYPDIVKIIAVGNEAMVKWAASYFVQPRVILKYVNQLQELKKQANCLPIFDHQFDNFASWGGGGRIPCGGFDQTHRSVDYVSMHTYPMHDNHYNPAFWGNCG
ncbi:MAG: hypothetical protein R2788_09435 [Saprospiraceae bacterium]